MVCVGVPSGISDSDFSFIYLVSLLYSYFINFVSVSLQELVIVISCLFIMSPCFIFGSYFFHPCPLWNIDFVLLSRAVINWKFI